MNPSYAVVIPTVGRPSLTAAVLSVLCQEPPPDQVVVVVDGPDPAPIQAHLAACAGVAVISTGGGLGPSGARMCGVRATDAPLVAFLDDDDEWLAGKMREQLDLFTELARRAPYPVVTCRAYLSYDNRHTAHIAPATTLGADESVPDYLFNRRQLLPQGFLLGSSCILTSRALLEREPWREQIALHEDWEWLLRVSRRADVMLRMHSAALIRYRKSSSGAHASRPPGGWRQSVEFAERAGLSPRHQGDFLLSVAAANAISHRHRREALRIAARVLASADASTKAWLVFVLRLVLPDRLLRGLVALVRRARHRFDLPAAPPPVPIPAHHR